TGFAALLFVLKRFSRLIEAAFPPTLGNSLMAPALFAVRYYACRFVLSRPFFSPRRPISRKPRAKA
ncbi:MAG: hypothetical protein ACK5ZU_15130, partial [Acidobacteriota bacterium]